MDTKALRQKILDLAIRGKLVPQDPNDEPASVLLDRIRAEKQQMVKDGRLKAKDVKNDTVIFVGEDNLHYEKFSDGTVKCIEDGIPFDVPDGWDWCNLSMVGQTNIGLTYKPSDRNLTGTMVLRSSNIVNGKIDLTDLVRVDCQIRDNQYAQENDILICARNGSKALVGKCAIVKGIAERASFGAFMAIYRTPYYRYVYHFLNSDVFREVFADGNSTAINQLTQDMIKKARMPFPPLAEQIRIADAVDKYLALIDDISEQSLECSKLIQKAKSSILDLAIRGQLVPQSQDDEPASTILDRIRSEKEELVKQGKLKRDKRESAIFRGEDNSYYETIGGKTKKIDEELAFEVPDSWALERLKNIYTVNPRNTISDDTMVAFVPMALIDDQFSGKFTYDEKAWKDCKTGFTHFADGDVGFAKISPCFENRKSAIFSGLKNGFGAGTTELTILRSAAIFPEYTLCFLKSAYFIGRGIGTFSGVVGQQRVDKNVILDTIVSLPPQNEQKRIAERINQLFSLLDSIEASIH